MNDIQTSGGAIVISELLDPARMIFVCLYAPEREPLTAYLRDAEIPQLMIAAFVDAAQAQGAAMQKGDEYVVEANTLGAIVDYAEECGTCVLLFLGHGKGTQIVKRGMWAQAETQAMKGGGA